MGVLNAALAVCIACHGAHGEGNSSGVPRLAGQNAAYLAEQLSALKSGKRASAIMQPIASNLSDADIAALADYFSKQAAPAPALPPLAVPSNLQQCFGCHGAQGKGNGAHFPAIAGQTAQYTIDRLHAFQARARVSAPQPGTMTEVAGSMDERQIRQAAAYLSQPAR